jgi:hypothetical protein
MKTANGQLNNLFEVQQFLGFCNDYRRFISTYCEKPEQLTSLNKKDEPFVWGSKQQLAFEMMVTTFTKAPAIRHFDHKREVIIETDASYCVFAEAMSQRDDDGVLHPVAYYSKKH